MTTKVISEDCTIACICVHEIEYAAIRDIFDKEVMPLEVYEVPGRYKYILGIIGRHKVVAVYRHARSSQDPLTVTLTHLFGHFPSVQVGFFVGIGGGVPGNQDIRLGDVVIGRNNENTQNLYEGGPYIIDQDNIHQDGIHEANALQRFSYGAPYSSHEGDASIFGRSMILKYKALGLSSVVQDRSVTPSKDAHKIDVHKVDALKRKDRIRGAIQRRPSTQRVRIFPGRKHDKLFLSFYQHVVGDGCNGCDETQIIKRMGRVDDEPVVHYGIIASRNQDIQDAFLRDQIHKKFGAICIESGAAGMMSNFPYLVIQGICHYSDSHQNSRWEGYAALTAAAFFKTILANYSEEEIQHSIETTNLLHITLPDITMLPNPSMPNTNSKRGLVISPDLVHQHSSLSVALVTKFSNALVHDTRFGPIYSEAVFRTKLDLFCEYVAKSLRAFSVRIMTKDLPTPLEKAIGQMITYYGASIANRIYNLISLRGEAQHKRRLLSKDFPPTRLIEEYFLFTQPPVIKANVDIGSDNEDGGTHRTEDLLEEDYCQKYLEDAFLTLEDESKLDQILCSGAESEEMYKMLKLLFLPSPAECIKSVLNKHWPSYEKIWITKIYVEWKLLEYIMYEDVTAEDIESIFTLTGEFDSACAARLGDYICETWSTGNEFLEAIKSILNGFLNDGSVTCKFTASEKPRCLNSIELIPRSDDENEHAFVEISGSFSETCETLEQFAWVAATLRPHVEGQLTVSEINFRADPLLEGEMTRPVFSLSLRDEREVIKFDSSAPGQCWTSLFTESILAYGFTHPSKTRPSEVKGLEIPFPIMAAFSGAKYPVRIGEMIGFTGKSGILIPKSTSGDSIQWHYRAFDNQATKVPLLRFAEPQSKEEDLNKLTELRAFLGYYRYSEVLLGSEKFMEINITKSEVDLAPSRVMIKPEGTVNVSLGFKGYFTLSTGMPWKLNHREAYKINTENLSPSDRFRHASQNSALLYDDQRGVAFLISELSIVLQMVCSYLQKESSLERRRIPQAKPSADGGAAAYEAIHNNQNLMVPFGQGDPQKYSDIVIKFLDIIDGIKTLVESRRECIRFSLKDGLRGWDYTEIQTKENQVWERMLPTRPLKPRPIWWDLFETSPALIFFARLPEIPIRSCKTGHEYLTCTAWEDIPRNGHILLASMSQLLKLKEAGCRELRVDKYPDRYMLSEKLAWVRPQGSRLFDECVDGGRCNPLQTMRHIGDMREYLWRLKRGNMNVLEQYPGDFPLDHKGAVMFADNPLEFERRQCQLDNRPEPRIQWSLFYFSIFIGLFAFSLGLSKLIYHVQQYTERQFDGFKQYFTPPLP